MAGKMSVTVLLLLALALQAAPGAASAPASKSNAALVKEPRNAYDPRVRGFSTQSNQSAPTRCATPPILRLLLSPAGPRP
jgi:hypothetical protein